MYVTCSYVYSLEPAVKAGFCYVCPDAMPVNMS